MTNHTMFMRPHRALLLTLPASFLVVWGIVAGGALLSHVSFQTVAGLGTMFHGGLLLLIIGVWVLGRCPGFHPALNPPYRRWLEASPWLPGMPLPVAPVHFVVGDILILAASILLLEADLRIGEFPSDLRLLVIAAHLALTAILYSVGVCRALLRTGPTYLVHAIGFAIPATFILARSPSYLIAVSLGLFVLGSFAAKMSVRQYPWKEKTDPAVPGYFPKLLQYLSPDATTRKIKKGHGLLLGAMAGWFSLGLIQLFAAFDHRISLGGVVLCAILLGILVASSRATIYGSNYHPPLRLISRIWLGYLIIPRYHIVKIAPFITVVISFVAPPALYMMGVPDSINLAITVAAIVVAATETGPTLYEWRFTGAHRLPPDRTHRSAGASR